MNRSLRIPKERVSLVASSLLPKLERLALVLILLLFPTQLGLHFWPPTAFVYGVRVDYLAPTLYFLDCLMAVYLLLRAIRSVLPVAAGRTDLMGIPVLLPLLLVNLLYSQNPLATLSWSLHLLLYTIFTFLVFPGFQSFPGFRSSGGQYPSRSVLDRNSRLQAEKGPAAAGRTDLIVPLLVSMFFQVALGATQVILGHSVGGLLYYLGERNVAVGAPSIALASIAGHSVLRAYGTFGHPNVLAGWLVIVYLIILRLLDTGSDPFRKSWPTAKMFSRLQNTIGRPGQTLWVLSLIVPLATVLATLGILLAQSRAAALAFLGFVVPFSLLRAPRTRLIYGAIIIVLAMSYWPLVVSDRFTLSLSERLNLQALSLRATAHFPVFGTGAQASISTYPTLAPQVRLFQPDHNSFTLLLSWFGIFGLLSLLLLWRSYIGVHWPFAYWCTLLLPIAPIFLFDHYLLTSPQGLLILVLYIRATITLNH